MAENLDLRRVLVFIFGSRQEGLDAAVAELGQNATSSSPMQGSQLALGKITAEHLDEIFDTNVKGSIFTVQKALPPMERAVILTGSSAGTTDPASTF